MKHKHKLFVPFYLAIGIVALYTIIHQYLIGHRVGMIAMNDFMGIRFILFGALKFIDIEGFADTYMHYDIIARKWKAYGYLFPVFEILLGIGYIADTQMQHRILINGATVILVGITGIGIRQALRNKKDVDCVCMGTKFPLPMSNINFIENFAMGLMAVIMLFWMGNISMSNMAHPGDDLTTNTTTTGAICHY